MKLKFLIAIALVTLFAGSCKKDSKNPVFDNNLEVGSYLTLDSTLNINFNTTDLSDKVGVFVGSVGEAVDKIKLFVVDNSSANQNWKLVKTIDYTGDGTEVSATGNEIATALSYAQSDFIPGTTLTLFTQVITKSGKTYDINNGGLNIEAPDYNSVFRVTIYIVCPFTGGIAGDYKVIEDDWADYSAGTVITGAVEDGPGANQISLHVYPNPDIGTPVNPIVVDIDPETGSATVPEVVYGDYGGTSASISGSGYVFSCTGTITLTLDHNYGGTVYGGLKLILQKQ